MAEALKEAFQLYLEWKRINYNDNTAQLDGALFYGPVLKRAARLHETDTIKLDFTEQHEVFVVVPGFYVATLSWRGIKYLRDDVIALENCTLTHNKAGTLRELNNDNFFVIDCELHEEYNHAKYLTYQAWVLDNDGNPLGLD